MRSGKQVTTKYLTYFRLSADLLLNRFTSSALVYIDLPCFVHWNDRFSYYLVRPNEPADSCSSVS